MKIPINNIIPSSIVDGPGNRTAIFVQGCNLRCGYCHNPETIRVCINCGVCVKGCPTEALTLEDKKVVWDEGKCIKCDQCIDICPHFSSPRVKFMAPNEVFDEIKDNIPFIRGITVSGGECTLYPEFLTELFNLVKPYSLTCLIDSNGMIDLSAYPELLEACDGVMLDIKAWDPSVYKRLTEFDNSNVKKNLKLLSDLNLIEELRIVCVPGEVDEENTIKGIKSTIGSKVKDTKLKLIRFRNHGVKGRLKNKKSPDDEYMGRLKKIALDQGFENVLIV